MRSLIIVGAGGFALEVAAYVEDILRSGKPFYPLRGFLDDGKPVGTPFAGYEILGKTDLPIDSEAVYALALGSPQARKALTLKLGGLGASFANIVHPSAYVAETASLGKGVILAPFTFVGPKAEIGDQAFLNVHSMVDHEAKLGRFSVLCPYAGLHGTASAGEEVLLGSHAYVTAGFHIEDGVKIEPGKIVTG